MFLRKAVAIDFNLLALMLEAIKRVYAITSYYFVDM